MLEIYLFINPISESCYKTEKKLTYLIKKSNNKISFRVLPLLNLNTIKKSMLEIGLPINMHKRVVSTLYQSSIDYEAALFQGKKCGREFLFKIQECILKNNFTYTNKMVNDVIQSCNLDIELFREDRNSELAKNSFKKKQKLAAEMQISYYPTVIVYNNQYSDCALSLNPLKSFNILKKIILNPKETLIQINNHKPYLHSIKLK